MLSNINLTILRFIYSPNFGFGDNYGFFFSEKKGGSCALLFYQKAAIEKKAAPAAGLFQKTAP